MVDDSTATRSASELAAGIRSKEWSSRELLDIYLARIDRRLTRSLQPQVAEVEPLPERPSAIAAE